MRRGGEGEGVGRGEERGEEGEEGGVEGRGGCTGSLYMKCAEY